MPLHRLFPGLLALVFAAFVPVARAHDPFVAEIRAEADATTITVRLTFARSVAAHLAGVNEAPRRHYPPERFATDRAAFETAAATLEVLTLDSRSLPLLKSATATLADGGEDVVFTLAYARPVGTANLILANPWLARLPVAENYAAIFMLHEGPTLRAGPLLVSNENPVVTFALPAPATSVSPAGPVAADASPRETAPGVSPAGLFKRGVE